MLRIITRYAPLLCSLEHSFAGHSLFQRFVPEFHWCAFARPRFRAHRLGKSALLIIYDARRDFGGWILLCATKTVPKQPCCACGRPLLLAIMKRRFVCFSIGRSNLNRGVRRHLRKQFTPVCVRISIREKQALFFGRRYFGKKRSINGKVNCFLPSVVWPVRTKKNVSL